jgi:hypothetical protein
MARRYYGRVKRCATMLELTPEALATARLAKVPFAPNPPPVNGETLAY